MKILILEDLQDDVVLIRRMLLKGGLTFESEQVETREDFITAIHKYKPDVILSDHTLPEFNSLEALTICRNANLSTPFILVTGTVSEEFAVVCLKHGADDYVLKSNLTRLPSVILNAIRQRELQDHRLKSESELRYQNEELVKINRELDTFVYSISHNLRSPLMSVLGLLNLARQEDTERDNYFNQYFQMMNQSISRLDDTLKEILDYSRNAREDITYQVINMKEIAQNSVDRLKYLNGFDDVEKYISIVEEAPFYSDAYRVRIILNNLISNAIKYKDSIKEKSTITISGLINFQKATLTIKDNGTGINKANLSKIFDMFFRGSEKSDGAGLGLYIVKEIVGKLQGTISVESEIHKGTKFTVELPNNFPGINRS